MGHATNRNSTSRIHRLGWLTMQYSIYPNKIQVRNIFTITKPVQSIPLSDVISIKVLTKEEEKERTMTTNRKGRRIARRLFEMTQSGNYGTIAVQTGSETIYLENIRHPENAVQAIEHQREKIKKDNATV